MTFVAVIQDGDGIVRVVDKPKGTDMKRFRELQCRILGHEVFDAETLRLRPWTWGEFRGYSAQAFAHEDCLRCHTHVRA